MKLEILNRCLCLCAKRNSGKSVLLKYIVQANKGLFNLIFVICPSESINKFYSDIVPKNIYLWRVFQWMGGSSNEKDDGN